MKQQKLRGIQTKIVLCRIKVEILRRNLEDCEVCCIGEEYPHEIDDLEGVNIYEAEF